MSTEENTDREALRPHTTDTGVSEASIFRTGDSTVVAAPVPAPVRRRRYVSDQRSVIFAELLIRVVGLAACAVALVFLVTNSKTSNSPVQSPDISDPTTSIPFAPPPPPSAKVVGKVKWSTYTSFLVLAYAAGISGAYLLLHTLLGLIYCIAGKNLPAHSPSFGWLVFFVDQLFTYGLVAITSVAAETLYIAYHGSTHAGWNSFCQYYGHFCDRIRLSIILSYIGAIMLAISAAISAHNLYVDHQRRYIFPK